jgi:amino-acid N-acetyltransferase
LEESLEYLDPPPFPKPLPQQRRDILPGLFEAQSAASELVIKHAKIGDVEEILDLINHFASSNVILPRGPIYLYENIRDFVIAVDQKVPVYCVLDSLEELHLIAACGSLHVLWADIAEIRALAIHPDYMDGELEKRLVDFMKVDALKLGVKCLVIFTVDAERFEKLGFKLKSRSDLPPKAWGECIRCPKYFRCDEVAMVLEL